MEKPRSIIVGFKQGSFDNGSLQYLEHKFSFLKNLWSMGTLMIPLSKATTCFTWCGLISDTFQLEEVSL